MCRVYAMDIMVSCTSLDRKGLGSVSGSSTSSPSRSDPVRLQVLTSCMMENHHLYDDCIYYVPYYSFLVYLPSVYIMSHLASASTSNASSFLLWKASCEYSFREGFIFAFFASQEPFAKIKTAKILSSTCKANDNPRPTWNYLYSRQQNRVNECAFDGFRWSYPGNRNAERPGYEGTFLAILEQRA